MSSSTESTGSTGKKWKGVIYFIPEAETCIIIPDPITHKEMFKEFNRLKINLNDPIEKIWMYSSNLLSIPIQLSVFYHAFVVIESKNWFWSIEKNNQNITIQRSKRCEYVLNKYRCNDRYKPICELKFYQFTIQSTAPTMQQLFDWLSDANELRLKYRFAPAFYNCQGFAERLVAKLTNEYCQIDYEDLQITTSKFIQLAAVFFAISMMLRTLSNSQK